MSIHAHIYLDHQREFKAMIQAEDRQESCSGQSKSKSKSRLTKVVKKSPERRKRGEKAADLDHWTAAELQ